MGAACCCAESKGNGTAAETLPVSALDGREDGNAAAFKDDGAVEEFEVYIEKAPEGPLSRIGLDINRNLMTALRITKLKEGCVMEWNTRHPEKKVQPEDRIVQVNGIKGSADQLVETIRSNQKLHLLIQRPS